MPTTNMGLTQPGVLTTVGPTYATQQNTDLTLIDAHDHSSGKGVQVSQTGLLFTGDLSYQNGTNYYGPTNLAYAQFHQQTLQGAGTKPAALMVDASGNLYYQNGSGTNVQVTSGSNIVQTGTGTFNGFYGDYAAAGPTHGATATFDSASGQFRFFTDSGSTVRAAVVGLGYRSLGSSSNSTGFINTKSDGTAGWQLWNNAGTSFYLTFNPTSSPVNAFALVTAGVNSQYLLGLNRIPLNYPVEVSYAGSGNESSAYTMGRFIQLTNGGGAPANGFGMSWRYEAAVAEGTGATPSIMILQDMSWKTAASRIGRWRVYGYTGGSSDATPGIELIGGGPAVGIGTTANAAFPLSVGATAGVSATLAGSLTVAAGGLTVSAGGATITAGGLTVGAGTSAVQALTATTGSFSSTLAVTGTSTLGTTNTGAFTGTTGAFSSTLSSAGATSLSTGGGATTTGGNLTVANALSVTGASTFVGGFTANTDSTVAAKLTVNNNLTTTGNLAVNSGGTLTVSGASTFNSTVTGSSTISGTVLTATDTGTSGALGAYNVRNNVTFWAQMPAAGTTPTNSYNFVSMTHAATGNLYLHSAKSPGCRRGHYRYG
jgi:hypothetical protein